MNIFEATNTGNLNELKKFKVHGSDLKSKDGDGNSVFLWAASSGHLEILKWLFDEGIATIDEQNNAGNDALHLASAYGHTQLCKWLIDLGSSLNKVNKFGSNALTIALKHNQLPIVDLLVRHFNQSLAQSPITYCNNSALNYYIKIVELFSHKLIKHEDILRVIEDASSQLHNDELSYIYLIYHWLNINTHGIDASIGAPQVFDANRLSLPHRTEFIAQMFNVGIISTAETNQLIIRLDDAQKTLVTNWLNVKTTDNYFLSKQNQTERDELYTNFYLTPLYRSITYALKIGGDLNSALREPDKYYALNLSEGSFMDIDAARWTAYHLCRNNHISSAQHTANYKKTTGESRRAYYDTLILFVSKNNELQINSLLRELGNIPDSNGERLLWSVRYPVWLAKWNTTLGARDPASRNGTLKLVGHKNVIHLSNDVSSIILDVAKQKLNPSTLPGNHLVYHLKKQDIYCKLYPGLPGINDAIQCLYRRLFGANGGVPWSVTGLLEIGGQCIPVIISEDKGEKLVEDDARLAKLNQYALSKLILFSMITNPEDGKCDNYTLKQDTSGNFLIYSVDNDQGLVDGIIEADGWIFNSKKLSVKTVLFCLDSMNQPLHPQAVREFLALNSVEIIKEWLSDLVKLESEYNTLFKGCRELFAAQENPSWRSYSYQLMPIATVMNLAFKVQSLQSSLQANNSITAIALLKTVELSIAGYYQEVLKKKELSPTARFDELVKNEKLYGYNKVTKTYSTTLTSAKELFQSFVPSNQASSVSPGIAREIFEEVTKQRQLITEIQTKILKGDITQLKSLSMREQQNLMKLIQFNQIDRKKVSHF